MRSLVMPAALSALLALAGCAGGGDRTSGAGLEKPPGMMEEDVERRERLAAGYRSHPAFGRQWGLGRVRADQAHARIALKHGEDVRPGAGVTVGIFDTGIDEEHPAFAHTRIDEVFLTEAADETGVLPSHGTAVAGVIAGGRESALPGGAQGIASGAELVVFAFGVDPEPPPEPDPELPTEYFPEWSDIIDAIDGENAAELRTVLDWRDGERRVDFLNLSVGGFGMIDGYTETELRSVYDETIETIAQDGVDEKTVFVWAAGNANGLRCLPNQPYCLRGMVAAGSPGYDAGLAARISEVRGHTVAVVAVKEDGEIAEYSNRCGLAARWCIAAPGDGMNLAYFGPDEETGEPGARGTSVGGGTSFAAPMVAGGLAVMKHLFRGQLSNTDLLARLLETADRSGRYADEAVYGRGLMDLGAATSPVGSERVAGGSRVNGAGRTLRSTRLDLGRAVGDGLTRSFASREFVVFDSLGAPFWHGLGSRMRQTGPSPAWSRLDALTKGRPVGTGMGPDALVPPSTGWDDPDRARWEVRLLDAPAGIEAGHLGLAEKALALRYAGSSDLVLSAFSTGGMEGMLPVVGGAFSWRRGPFGLRSGWIAERESALGTTVDGGFGRLAANAFFIGFDAEATVAAWRVFGGAEFGFTRAEADDGLIEDLSSVETSSVSLHAERALAENQTIRFSVAQPLRVEAGRAELSVPVGRTSDGNVLRERMTGSLVPSGRQVDLSVQWRRRLDGGGAFALGAYFILDPGHRAGDRPNLELFAGFGKAF